MLIVCEGVDNGGKTTLIQELARLHNDPAHLAIRHQGVPPEGVSLVELYERELLTDLLPLIRSSTSLVLLDRHHIGELLYGPVYRTGSRLSAAGNLHVELLLQALGAVRVLVQPQRVEVVKRRYAQLGDHYLHPQHVDHVHAGYERHGERYGWIRGSRLEDEGTLGPEGLLKLAEATTWVTQFTRDVPGYVGPHSPRVVLVGDERSTGPGDVPALWTTAAFTPMREASSAAWLLRTLEAAHAVRDIGLLNAHEPGMDLKVAWGLLRRPRLVALGGAADAALTAAELPHTRVHHPQYARRFNHHRPGEYAASLKRAIESAPDPSRDR